MPLWDSAFIRRLEAALALDLPYSSPQRMIQKKLNFTVKAGLPAGVLILLGGSSPDSSQNPRVLFTRRTEKVETHKGQIAFPGGVVDPGDRSGENSDGLIAAALRETEEEVGISRTRVRVIGRLPALYAVTGFQVTPVIGVLEAPLESIQIKPNPDEIADFFWAPLSVLLSSDTYQLEYYPVGPARYPIHVYQVGPHRIWGLTGEILKNFLDRWVATGGIYG